MNYNKEQEEAINTIDGALLIVSCPGSGKTTTMLRRIQNMIEHGISPNNILMVTFTEAAAREMRERFEKQSGRSGVLFAHCIPYVSALLTYPEKGRVIISLMRRNQMNLSEVRCGIQGCILKILKISKMISAALRILATKRNVRKQMLMTGSSCQL